MLDTPPSRLSASPLGVSAIVGLFALLLLGTYFRSPIQPPDAATWRSGHQLSALYDPPTRPVETLIGQGDGQIFVTQAQDPLLRRPELIRGGPAQQAYRFQRPLSGWLGWVASGGQGGAAPWALLVISALSVMALAGVTGRICVRNGRSAAWGLLVPLFPGAFTDMTWVGPEALATTLVLAGLGLWAKDGRSRWGAVACFALAGLTRESMLLIPAALCAVELYRRRSWRDIFVTASAAVPYVAWVGLLRLRLGALPGAVSGPRVSPLPFAGMLDRVPHWRPIDAIAAAAILLPAVVAIVLRSDATLRVLIAVNLAFASILGSDVWSRFADFGRVLLPLSALSLLALCGVSLSGRRSVVEVRGATGDDDEQIVGAVISGPLAEAQA